MSFCKPKDLPGIKRYFAEFFGRRAQGIDLPETAQAMQQQVQGATMMWVSEEMSILATTATDSLPAGTGNFYTDECGIVMFNGGTGIKVTMDYMEPQFWSVDSFGQTQPPSAEIDGVLWVQVEDNQDPLFIGISLEPGIKRADESKKALLVDVSGENYVKVYQLMRAMWLLSSQEGLASERLERVAKGGGKRAVKSAQQVDNFVRVVSVHRPPHEYRPPREGQGKWQLDHQVMVSGHWKNQPYGPRDAGLRKPQYIRPYIKGPDGTKLVVRPTVKVWS